MDFSIPFNNIKSCLPPINVENLLADQLHKHLSSDRCHLFAAENALLSLAASGETDSVCYACLLKFSLPDWGNVLLLQ